MSNVAEARVLRFIPVVDDIPHLGEAGATFAPGTEVVITEKPTGTVVFLMRSRYLDMDGVKCVEWYNADLLGSVPVLAKIFKLFDNAKQVVVTGVQTGPDPSSFQLFDVWVDGKYRDWAFLAVMSEVMGLPLVPKLWGGLYNHSIVRHLAAGRAGVIVRPLEEETHPLFGRLLFQFVSEEVGCEAA